VHREEERKQAQFRIEALLSVYKLASLPDQLQQRLVPEAEHGKPPRRKLPPLQANPHVEVRLTTEQTSKVITSINRSSCAPIHFGVLDI
jgi:hypothetical protein